MCPEAPNRCSGDQNVEVTVENDEGSEVSDSDSDELSLGEIRLLVLKD